MPEELRSRLEERAKATGRSTNAEIMTMLAAALDAESDLASIPIEALLGEVCNRLGAHVQIVVAKDAAEKADIEERGASSASRAKATRKKQ